MDDKYRYTLHFTETLEVYGYTLTIMTDRNKECMIAYMINREISGYMMLIWLIEV